MLGERIKAARLEKGLSQAELALGFLSRSYICELERNKRRPSTETIRGLAERLGKPLGYFLEDEQQQAIDKATLQLSQVRSLIGIADLAGARSVLESLQNTHRNLPVAHRAMYHELSAWLEEKDNQAMSAIRHALLAEALYEEAKLPLKQWYCLHIGAHTAYLANLHEQTVELGQRALIVITRLPAHEREKKLTLNLLGNAYFVLGRTSLAEQHYSAALACTVEDDLDTQIRLYHGRSLCAEQQGKLDESMLWAEEASFLAKRKMDDELAAQCEISRGLCLIRLRRYEDAMLLMKEQLKNTTLSSALRIRFHADYLLAFADEQAYPADLCTVLTADLNALLCEASIDDDYLALKGNWAIAKCALRLADPLHISPVIVDFAQGFERFSHPLHAARVLEYGAKLLEEHGDIATAYELLKGALRLK